MSAWSQFTTRIRRASGVADFAFHDLRRLLMTEAAEHRIAPLEVLDGCLNHCASATRRDVRRHYLHADLLPAKRAAMTEWGKIVAYAIEHGRWQREDAEEAEASTVVPFRSAR
jgi:hypothetical protein